MEQFSREFLKRREGKQLVDMHVWKALSCDEQEGTREDFEIPSSKIKGAEQVKKEASKDGSGAWKIVSDRRVNNVLRLVLIRPPYSKN